MKKLFSVFALISIFASGGSASAQEGEIQFETHYFKVTDILLGVDVDGPAIQAPNSDEQACVYRQKKIAEEVLNESQYSDFLKASGVKHYRVSLGELDGYPVKKKWASSIVTSISGGNHYLEITILRDKKCIDYSESDLRLEMDTLIAKSSAIHLNIKRVVDDFGSQRSIDSNKSWASVGGSSWDTWTKAGETVEHQDPYAYYTLSESKTRSATTPAK